MIRKQIYIEDRQQEAIRAIAKSRGVSEAEVIREAIDGRRGQESIRQPLDLSAWRRAVKLMRSLRPKKGAAKSGAPGRWNRSELYEGRLSRYGRDTR